MTAIEPAQRGTLVECEKSTLAGAIEMAAAAADVRTAYLLRKSFERSSLSQKDLSDRLGVTEGRVSQVLKGDGNVHTRTLARYLAALGYELKMDAVPASPGIAALNPRRP